jgi:hypothetical protein
MIKIQRSTTNIVFLTLSEKTTITDPTYLFSFINQTTKVAKNFICDSTSDTDRGQQFNIVEVGLGTEDLLNGEIKLLSNGTYNYYIYAQSSTSNLDPDDADEMVENGIVIIDGESEITYVSPSDDTDTYTVHQE